MRRVLSVERIVCTVYCADVWVLSDTYLEMFSV